MQMLCKVSADLSDVRCPICGQGFLVYWTRSREIGRAEQRSALQSSLREQHINLEAADIHAAAFELPDIPAAMPTPLPQAVPAHAMPLYN